MIILIFNISHPFPTYFGLKWTIMVFLLFFQFLTIFMEFSITLRVRTKWNDNFYFLPFSAFSNLFWLIMKPHWYFFNFFNFFAIFLEFSLIYRLGTERNGTIIFISLFLIYFKPILAWNELIMVFLNFFVLFLEFSISRRIGTKQNYNFYFLSVPAFSSLFWLKMNPQWYFLIFWIFLPFF